MEGRAEVSPGIALGVGVALGTGAMVLSAAYIILRRGNVTGGRHTIVVLVTIGIVQLTLAIATGSFKSGIVLLVGVAVGVAISSIITLPMLALTRKRFE